MRSVIDHSPNGRLLTIDTSTHNVSMDGIELATRKEDIDNNILNSETYSFEFNPNHELITMSARLIHEFAVDGRVVNFDNIGDFLSGNEVSTDGSFLIIPGCCLSLHVDHDMKIFLEVLVYSSSVRKQYENGGLRPYDDRIGGSSLVLSAMVFIPFVSVGEYIFGESEEAFVSQTKLAYHDSRGVNGKKYYHVEDIAFRFDQDRLSQIYINNPDIDIILDQANINTIEGTNSLLNQYSVIKSRSHNILLDIGVAIKSKIETTKDIEYYFFNKDLVKYWQNIHRPITSW